MFGRNNGEKKEKPEWKVDAKYIGGHPAFPKEKDTKVAFYGYKMVIGGDGGLEIPYAGITDLGGKEDRHITKTRVFVTGPIIGLLWKKIFRYTVVTFKGPLGPIEMVLDFHGDAQKVNQYLYQKVGEVKAVG